MPMCYDFSNMENLLNEKTVKDSLGVGDLEFVSCSRRVHAAMLDDWVQNLEVGIPSLLEDGIKVLGEILITMLVLGIHQETVILLHTDGQKVQNLLNTIL